MALAGVALIAGMLSAPPDFNHAKARYFDREDGLNIGYMVLGTASVATGAWLITQDDELSSGAGYPLVIVGAIQVTSGAVFLGLTRAWIDEAETAAGERARMEAVHALFPVYLGVELAVATAGLVTMAVGTFDDNPTARGAGLGLFAAGAGQIIMESTVYHVATDYLVDLQTLKVSGAPIDNGGLWLGVSGRF